MGVTVATRAAGLSVAMVESRDFGGTCPNRGCKPKKMLVAAGHTLHEIERAHVHGIAVSEPKLDWAVLIDREKQMISHIPGSLGRLMAGRGVEVIRGDAVFAGPNAARVRDRMIEARLIVVATGSKLRPLPFPGRGAYDHLRRHLNQRDLPHDVVLAAASSRSNSVTSMRVSPRGHHSASSHGCPTRCNRFAPKASGSIGESCGELPSTSPHTKTAGFEIERDARQHRCVRRGAGLLSGLREGRFAVALPMKAASWPQHRGGARLRQHFILRLRRSGARQRRPDGGEGQGARPQDQGPRERHERLALDTTSPPPGPR